MAKKAAPITMAVVGLGHAGWDIHVKAIRGREDFALTEVMDPDKSRLAEAQTEFGCQTFTDWKSFLRNSDAELVVIAALSQDHCWMAREALAAGKHVVVEKPMATSLGDVEKMIAAADKYDRLLTVHQSARFMPEYLHIQEQIRRGVLGRIFSLRRSFCSFARRNDWQVFSKYGGGQLNNNGVHIIDQVVQLLDAPVTTVFGDLQQILNPGDVEDHVKVVMRTEAGMVADVEIGVSALPLPTWVLMGTKGTLVSDGKVSKLRYLAGKLPPLKPMDKKAVPGRRYGTGETIEFKEEEVPATATSPKNYYDYLYESVRKGKPLFVTPESVWRTMRVLKMARKGTPFA